MQHIKLKQLNNNMKKISLLVFLPLALSLISGCASTYPCGEPSAGKCASVSDNYEHSFTDYTNPDDVDDGRYKDSASTSVHTKADAVQFSFSKYAQTPADGSPLISQPKMMRVWLTPYTDSDNIYHEQGYEYMLTNRGNWLFGNNKLKTSNNIKNISLVQSVKANTQEQAGFNPQAKVASPTSPNAFLNDYPALNALKNQSVPINHTTSPLTGSVTNTSQ